MSRYIDADALGIGKADRNAFKIPEYADGWNSAIEIIANAPTADVVEVRHGHWEEENRRPKSSKFICSVCGELAYYIQPSRDKTWKKGCHLKYCPNCGAKMGGEKRSENEKS